MLLSERYCQKNEKTSHRLEENICKRHVQIIKKGVLPKICKELLKVNNNKINNPIKNEQKISTDTWQNKILRWQLSIWKYVHISLHVHAKSLQSCLTLCDPMDHSPSRLLCPWDSPGKHTGMGCHALLQGIFLTQGSNPRLLHLLWQTGSLPLAPTEKSPHLSLENCKLKQDITSPRMAKIKNINNAKD